MNKRNENSTTIAPRMLTIKEACAYTGLGRTSCREWCAKIGAARHFGRRVVRYDKTVIDAALVRMGTQA